eukprot:4307747-Lingulodinium_polyedra.AAC.1
MTLRHPGVELRIAHGQVWDGVRSHRCSFADVGTALGGTVKRVPFAVNSGTGVLTCSLPPRFSRS